ncbi:MAG: hypothetical protein REI94_16575 [Moraxellaceae bacterium]|nr:hypothetical protein [Moraxellaceae bacterium]
MNTHDLPLQSNDNEASPAMLAASVLSMMTRFAESPDPDTAAQVIQHLETVAEDERSDPLIREIAHALAQRWQGHASHLCPASAVPGSAFHH